MMQRKVLGTMVFVLFIAVLCLPVTAFADENTGLPRAVVENPVHDWGSVYAGKTIIHSFVIRNKGEAPLEIGNVRVG